jgi:hypothetical protein
MGVLKRGPVIGKNLLEDTPVPRDVCHHRVAPSEGDQVVWVGYPRKAGHSVT